MTTAQVVETSVTVNNNSPIQDYVHPDDQTQAIFEMTTGFKSFIIIIIVEVSSLTKCSCEPFSQVTKDIKTERSNKIFNKMHSKAYQ